MYPLQRALPRTGHGRGSVVPLDPCSENFFHKLWWEMTLFEFNSAKDTPQNKKQNNRSLVEEVWKHEAMGGIYELGQTKSHMWWENPQEHTPSTDASFTYRTVSLTPNQRSQIQSISRAVWGQVQVQEISKTRHLLQPAFQQRTSWPRLGALTSINTSMRL